MAAEHAALIGARIREARKAKRWSQRELAEAIPGKADGTQVSKWERGINRVSDDTLGHIAMALDQPVAWFHSTAPDKSQTPALLGADSRTLARELLAQISELGEQIQLLRAETATRDAEVLKRIDEALPPTQESQS